MDIRSIAVLSAVIAILVVYLVLSAHSESQPPAWNSLMYTHSVNGVSNFSNVVRARVEGARLDAGLYLLVSNRQAVPVLIVPGLYKNEYVSVGRVLWGGADFYEVLQRNPLRVMSGKRYIREELRRDTVYTISDGDQVYIIYPTDYDVNVSNIFGVVGDGKFVGILSVGGSSYRVYRVRRFVIPLAFDNNKSIDYKLIDRRYGISAEYVFTLESITTSKPVSKAAVIEVAAPDSYMDRGVRRPADWWWVEDIQRLAYSLPWLENVGDEEVPSAKAGVVNVPKEQGVEVCIPFRVAPRTDLVNANIWVLPDTSDFAAVTIDSWICDAPSPFACMLTHELNPRSGVTYKDSPFVVAVTFAGSDYLPTDSDLYLCVYAWASEDVSLHIHGSGEADFPTASPWAPDPRENTYTVSLGVSGRVCDTYSCSGYIATATGSLVVPLALTPSALERPVHTHVHLVSQPGASPRSVAVYLGDIEVCSGTSSPVHTASGVRQEYVCDALLSPWSAYSLLQRYISSGKALPLRVIIEGAFGEEWYLDVNGVWVNYTAIGRSFIDALPLAPGHAAQDVVYGFTGFTAMYDGTPSSFYAGEASLRLFVMRPYSSERGSLDVWIDVSGAVYSASKIRFRVRIVSDKGFSLAAYNINVPGSDTVKRYASYPAYILTAMSIAVGELPYGELLSTAVDVIQDPLAYMLSSGVSASCVQEAPNVLVCTGEASAGILGGLRSAGLRVSLYPLSYWGDGVNVTYDVEYRYVDGVVEVSRKLAGSYYVPLPER